MSGGGRDRRETYRRKRLRWLNAPRRLLSVRARAVNIRFRIRNLAIGGVHDSVWRIGNGKGRAVRAPGTGQGDARHRSERELRLELRRKPIHLEMSKGIDKTKRNSQYAFASFTSIVGISSAKPPSRKASFAGVSKFTATSVASATKMPMPTMPKPARSNLAELAGCMLTISTLD
jgi:hypothetical protein